MQPGLESDGADKPPTQAASAVDLALAKTPEGNKSEYVSPGGKRRSNRQSPKCSDAKDNLSADDSMSMIVEGFDQVPGGKRRRKKFSTSRRREVADVRKAGACLTCRTRKVKCSHSLLGGDLHRDPASAPKPIPQSYTLDTHASLPALSYSSTLPDSSFNINSLRDDVGQIFPNFERAMSHNAYTGTPCSSSVWLDDELQLPEVHDAPIQFQESMVSSLTDWDNVFHDNTRRSALKDSPTPWAWGQLWPPYPRLSQPFAVDFKDSSQPVPSIHISQHRGGPSGTNRSPSSSQTIAATDVSVDVETLGPASDIETDWEEGVNGRDHLYNEICESNQSCRLKYAEVGELRKRRVFEEPKKQKLIDSLMREFYTLFKGTKLDVRTCVGRHSSSQGSVNGKESKTNQRSSNIAGSKRAYNDVGHDPGEEDEKDEEEDPTPKRPKAPSKSPDHKIPGLKFACPFHQHNPRKYGINHPSHDANYRTCAGPGWQSVARIKEHLYRRHRIPIKCYRCGTAFKSQGALSDHQRGLIPCEVKPEEPVEGVTDEIEKKLKCRKRTSTDQSEEARWVAVYTILFPNEEIPSPYYEHDNDIAQFENYARRETPMAFLRLLENRVSTNRLTAELQNDLLEIVQECRIYVYRQYLQEATRNSQAPIDPDLSVSDVVPSQPSINELNGHANHETSQAVQDSANDSYGNDPDNLESIFQENFDNTVHSWNGSNAPTHLPQRLCLCDGPCFCMPSCSSYKPPLR